MRLVHYHCRVLIEVSAGEGLAQEHSIRHVLDDGFVGGHIFEADAVSHFVSQLHPHLLTHALCHTHRRHTSRLRAPYDAVLGVPVFFEVLRHLRGLPAPRLAYHHHDLVFADDMHQLVPHSKHRQASPLLSNGPRLGELRHGLALLQMRSELTGRLEVIGRGSLGICLLSRLLLRRRRRLFGRQPGHFAHHGAGDFPEFQSTLVLVLLFADLADEG
mmetsp:Transcript_23820/g.42455  ORF Transcript_23820/g.42455 Transcript_23820/m.42455 type:complete len:216 (-) Transcript_23820:925-1572(-)